MDSLNPVLQPVVRVWRGLSRPQQVGLGLVAAALIGLVAIISTIGHGADSAVAFQGLSNDDMAAVVTKLKDAKIPYELAEGGVIRVATGQVQEARLATVGLGLGGKPATGSGFELFNQPSFGQTEFTQKVNYQRALENELARSIDQMAAVETSRVHLVMPQQSLFSAQQKDTTASIILKLRPGRRLDDAQARSISNLVAGSVEGLKAQNLTIVDINGNTLSANDGVANSTGLSSKQMDTQRTYEATTERNLQAMLDRVLGGGKATVRVAAVMNWDQTEQTSETFTPGDTTVTPVRTSHEISETSTGGAAAAGGVPGAASNNGAVPTYQGGATGTGSSTTKTDTDRTFELNKSVQKVVRAPGAVTRLSVSVMLDNDPASPNPALLRSVQDAVNAAAGIDTTRGDVLTVTALAFNRDELLSTQASMAEAAQKEQLLGYAHLGALAVGPLLMLIVLFFILSKGRKKSARTVVVVAEAPAPVPIEMPIAVGAKPVPGRKPAQPIAEDPQKIYIREQIQLLGKSNPATVAQLIQTWMDEDRRN
jgi:flagellar M-ring protein FliF